MTERSGTEGIVRMAAGHTPAGGDIGRRNMAGRIARKRFGGIRRCLQPEKAGGAD